jgi:uncharacterized membrane protein YdbT with pleckstrin-like domain
MNLELAQLIRMKPQEKVIFFLRRHFFAFVAELLYMAVLSLVPIGGYVAVANLWPKLLIGSMSFPSLVLLTSAYYLIVWLFFIGSFVDYYLDAWVVTTQRVLNVEQQGIFARTISELDLGRVQDVTSEIRGVIPSIFNYGHVYIQTAGGRERFVFEQVYRPHEIRKRILELVEADQQRSGAKLLDEMQKVRGVQQ